MLDPLSQIQIDHGTTLSPEACILCVCVDLRTLLAIAA